MKIKELMEKFDYNAWGNAKKMNKNIFSWYYDKDCVIAYLHNELYLLFVIKSQRKYFSYFVLNTKLIDLGGFGYNISTTDLRMISNKEHVVIVDSLEYEKFKQKLVLEELQK